MRGHCVQGAKRQRTEDSPDNGFIKPEKAPSREQPTLAQLLQQHKGAQARPGSLRRPSLPIFESLRRPPSSRVGAWEPKVPPNSILCQLEA